MKKRVARYQKAGRKAAQWLLGLQHDDGSFTGPDFGEDVYHKTAYSLSLAGYFPQAHRLLEWVKENDLQDSGELRHYYSPNVMQVYKDAWMLHGAQRLGRFDISYPIMNFMATFQAPCGGFPCEGRDEQQVRSLATCFCGAAALYMGRLDVARKAGDCLRQMTAQQPDEMKYYFFMTLDGKLITPEIDADAQAIDATQPNQLYWEVGAPVVFLGRLYQATGAAEYLQTATSVFEFNLRCRDDVFAHGNSGKNGLGAAIYYSITGDERARDASCRLADFLVATQEPAGGWRYEQEDDTLTIRIDHAAEYNIWLQEISSILAARDA